MFFSALTVGENVALPLVEQAKVPPELIPQIVQLRLGLTGLAPYHDTEAAVPEDVKAKVAEVIAGLDAGTIATNVTLG